MEDIAARKKGIRSAVARKSSGEMPTPITVQLYTFPLRWSRLRIGGPSKRKMESIAEIRRKHYLPRREENTMRRAALFLLSLGLMAVGGCALPDWMVPRLWKPVSWSDGSRQAQQDRYDRKYGPSGSYASGTSNGVRPGMMGSSNYIPGASSNPFAP